MGFIRKLIPVYMVFSWILVVLAVFWLIFRYSYLFFATIYAVMIFAGIMLIYLALTWRHLPAASRQNICFNVAFWFVLAYVIVRANGLTLAVLMMNN